LVESSTLKELRNGRMTEGSKCYVQVCEFAEVGNGLLFASLEGKFKQVGKFEVGRAVYHHTIQIN
jgi:hypothetical protein